MIYSTFYLGWVHALARATHYNFIQIIVNKDYSKRKIHEIAIYCFFSIRGLGRKFPSTPVPKDWP